ncbi:MAG: flagellar GTP-binding protein [Planctomycetaceae bacterium]|nr:flagellar GTP-binding protein [Planctomycetaceae bacterium]
MVRTVMHHQTDRPRPDMPGKLFQQYLKLLQQELTEELAEQVITHVRDVLQPDQMDDEQNINAAMRDALARFIPVDPNALHEADPAGRDRPYKVALIGPTGVGKTTTIAKLAATFKLKQNLRVALLTIDTYRIAAVDQLRTYAGILQIPLHVVVTIDDMARALRDTADYDIVLIDTAGRSPRDDEKLDHLRQFIDAAAPHEVHLVLCSTCSQPVLIDTVERFSRIPTDRVIFTKLDEAVNFGVLVNVVRQVNKQISFITTGQEVPHQIEPGQSHRLAGLILGQNV